MKQCPLVSVYCQVYNTPELFLRQCIESVLSQTYKNIEFYILNNGCTDNSGAILEEYARTDSRIDLTTDDINKSTFREIELLPSFRGEYYTHIDSDDWWEPDYLERLVTFAEGNHLDLACTGRILHVMATGDQSKYQLPQQFVLLKEQFAEWLPSYHVFMRTVWGKLVRMNVFRGVNFQTCLDKNLSYGRDTLISFAILRSAAIMGIDDSALYHYRIHARSKSHQYGPRRFLSDICLYNDAIDFLSAYGPISARNRNFLQCVYSNAVTDTTNVIQSSSLPAAEKLREYRRIASHPLTQAAYRECREEEAVRSRAMLLQRALRAGSALQGEGDEDLRAVAQHLAPRCGRAVSAAGASLFLEEPELFRALVQDEPDTLLQGLLTRMEERRSAEKYAIPEAIRALAVEHPLLFQVGNAVFLQKYGGIYRKIWNRENLSALEEMTGLLLEGRVSGGRETFLQLYISLSAAEEQIPAFVFGKIRLAELYLQQNRLAECRAIAGELREMGVDNGDTDRLYHMLAETEQS